MESDRGPIMMNAMECEDGLVCFFIPGLVFSLLGNLLPFLVAPQLNFLRSRPPGSHALVEDFEVCQ